MCISYINNFSYDPYSHSRDAIYDSDDSIYKEDKENDSDDSMSDDDMFESSGIEFHSRMGKNFINGAAIAAENSLERNAGKHLLSSIGAASQRHHMGLDSFRQLPLSDFLGLEHCYSESVLRKNPKLAAAIDGKDQAMLLRRNQCTRTAIVSSRNFTPIADVPELNLLASAALARDAYKSKKHFDKSSKRKSNDTNNLLILQNLDFDNGTKNDVFINYLEIEDIICAQCNTVGYGDAMLLCTLCKDHYHIICLEDCNLPTDWTSSNWDKITDWNSINAGKACELTFDKKEEWLCGPCNSITHSFDGNNLNLMKQKIEAYPPAKKRREARRNRGENLLWSSLPAPLGPTAVPVDFLQDSWNIIPNNPVLDVSNFEVVVMPIEDQENFGSGAEEQMGDFKAKYDHRKENCNEQSLLDCKNILSSNLQDVEDHQNNRRIITNEVGTPCAKSTENSSDEDSFVSAKGSSFLEECTMDGVDSPTEHATSKMVHRSSFETSNKDDNLNPIPTSDATEAHTQVENVDKNETKSEKGETTPNLSGCINFDEYGSNIKYIRSAKDRNINDNLQDSENKIRSAKFFNAEHSCQGEHRKSYIFDPVAECGETGQFVNENSTKSAGFHKLNNGNSIVGIQVPSNKDEFNANEQTNRSSVLNDIKISNAQGAVKLNQVNSSTESSSLADQ